MSGCYDSSPTFPTRTLSHLALSLTAPFLFCLFQSARTFAGDASIDEVLGFIKERATLNDIGEINDVVAERYKEEAFRLLKVCEKDAEELESYEVQLTRRERVDGLLRKSETITLWVREKLPEVWIGMEWKSWGKKASYMSDTPGKKNKVFIKNPIRELSPVSWLLPKLEKNVKEPLGLFPITGFPIRGKVQFLLRLLRRAGEKDRLRILYLGAKEAKEKELEERKTIRIIAWFSSPAAKYSLLFIDLAREKPGGPAPLRKRDIPDLRGFCSKLRAEKDFEKRSLGKRIWQLLSANDRTLVEDVIRAPAGHEATKSKIAHALDDLLKRRDFCGKEDLGDLTLVGETKELWKLRRKLAAEDVYKLNRLLLESYYPQEIAKSSEYIVLAPTTIRIYDKEFRLEAEYLYSSLRRLLFNRDDFDLGWW